MKRPWRESLLAACLFSIAFTTSVVVQRQQRLDEVEKARQQQAAVAAFTRAHILDLGATIKFTKVSGVVFFDTRPAADFRQRRIKGALHLPAGEPWTVAPAALFELARQTRAVVVYGWAGDSAAVVGVARMLNAAHRNVCISLLTPEAFSTIPGSALAADGTH